MSDQPGRTCPLSYRYGAHTLQSCPEQSAETLYVIGGLYGNLPALDAIAALAARERGPVTLCFNGDFNWFDVDDEGFSAINYTVLKHDALLGNVEAELLVDGSEAGCGCAYPESVDASVVERSNNIHARLKQTALRHPEIIARLGALPMVRRYKIGDITIGAVHGDADSLAGWHFDVAALDDPGNRAWIDQSFAQSRVDVFACTHTCLPAMRHVTVDDRPRLVANNGAAGMPNFRGVKAGVLTRIGISRSPHASLYGALVRGVHVDALMVGYDIDRWERLFLANWPAGSPAHLSYFNRIARGPDYAIERAWPGRHDHPNSEGRRQCPSN